MPQISPTVSRVMAPMKNISCQRMLMDGARFLAFFKARHFPYDKTSGSNLYPMPHTVTRQGPRWPRSILMWVSTVRSSP